MTARGVVTYGVPEFAHSGREFFRTFRCVNHPAIHDEKLFEIHYGVHAETLLASLVAPSSGRLQSSAIMGSNSRLASSLGTKASTNDNACVGISLPESNMTFNSGLTRFISTATSCPFMPDIS